MRVQHNIPAMNSYRNYNNNAKSINKNLEKLSSGYRINRAGDDAAGLAISEKMRAQITGLEVAQKNAKDGISMVQTAEGALTEVHDMLNRMYSLAEQAGNGTYDNSVDRNQLNKEVEKLRDEINRIGQTTNFNGTKLFTGNLGGTPVKFENASGAEVLKSVDATYSGDKELDGLSITAGGDSTGFFLTAVSGYTWTVSGNNAGVLTTGTNPPTGSAAVNLPASGIVTATLTANTGTTLNSANVAGKSITVTLDLSKGLSASEQGTFKVSLAGPTDPTAMANSPTSVSISKSGIDLWVGDLPDNNNKINVQMGEISDKKLVIDSDHVDISSQAGALNSLSYIKDAIDYVSDLRGTLGAAQNRLEHTINNLSVMQENIQDAESTIRDTDVAEEMMKYTKNSILVQSAQAMLAQANQQPQSVLQLLQ